MIQKCENIYISKGISQRCLCYLTLPNADQIKIHPNIARIFGGNVFKRLEGGSILNAALDS